MLGKVLSLYKIGAKKIITAYQNLSDIGIYFGHSDRFHTKGDGKPYWNDKEFLFECKAGVLQDLTNQIDGVTQEFTIPDTITIDTPISVWFNGQRLFSGKNFILNPDLHTLTTLLDHSPETGDHLVIIIGEGNSDLTLSPGLSSVTTQNTDTVSFSGTGTSGSPLKADIDITPFISEQEWINDDIEATRAAALAQFDSNPKLVFVWIAKQ